MPTTLPVDVDAIESDLAAATERVKDLTAMLELAKRVYGHTDESEPVHERSEPSPEPRISGPLTDRGTTTAVKYVFARHPREVITLEDVVVEMKSLGWDNGSPEPLDTVRVTVGRWKKKEPTVIERVRLGHYRYTPKAESHVGQLDPALAAPNGLMLAASNGAGAVDQREGG